MDSPLIGLIPIVVFILIAWAISRAIKRYSNKHPPVVLDESAGIGGWLLLLIFGLMFFGPLMGFGRVGSAFTSVESQHPHLKEVAAWGLYKSAAWVAYLVVCCLSFYAGLGLLKGRDISVVKRAKILLWVIGPVASLFIGLGLPIMFLGEIMSFDPNTVGEFIGSLIASLIGAAIWTAYLTKSKRVRATYGDALSRSETQTVIEETPKMGIALKAYFNPHLLWQKRLLRIWLVLGLPFSIYLGYEAYDAHQWVHKWNQYDREHQEAVAVREQGGQRTLHEDPFWKSRIYAIDSEHNRDRYVIWSLMAFFSHLFLLILYKIGRWVWGGTEPSE
jgi:hypothetical protein